MFGLGVILSIAKVAKPFAGKIISIAKVATHKDSRDDFQKIYDSFKSKHDSDGDGKSDWTPLECGQFINEVVAVVLNRL
tara:strand:- start:1299 stop:1535 length:237 start_codon:yes stop_codon:yes gene_type:complete